MGICTCRGWKDNISIWSASAGLHSSAWMAGKCLWIMHTWHCLLYHSLCLPTRIQTTRIHLGCAGKAAVQVRGESSYSNEGKPWQQHTTALLAEWLQKGGWEELPSATVQGQQCLIHTACFLHQLYIENTALASLQMLQFTTHVYPKLICSW